MHSLLVAMLLFAAITGGVKEALALDCATDCNRHCRVGKMFRRNIYDPVCKSNCESYKGAVCKNGLPDFGIPDLPANPEQWPKAACLAVFENAMTTFKAPCAAPSGLAANNHKLEHARSWLTARRLITEEEFARVELKRCKFPSLGRPGGQGLTASEKLIYIDDSYFNGELEALVGIIAHEFVHVRQWRSRGEENFKCEYAKGAAKHGLGPKHEFEREAYEFGDAVSKAYVSDMQHRLLPNNILDDRFHETHHIGGDVKVL